MENKVWIILVVVVILGIATVHKIDTVEQILETGKHLENAKVYMSISQGTPWEKLPIFVRDDMAKGWSGNRLGKEDLIEIRDYYNNKIANYVEPIGIGEDFNKDGKLVTKEE